LFGMVFVGVASFTPDRCSSGARHRRARCVS
jgi:hypothetical protein